MGICKWGLPLELWRAQVEVEVINHGLARFKNLPGKHVVIVCNHSNQYDPEVMFTFSKMAGEDFRFIAAREVFDWLFGLVGWWFQSLGCYSVTRGAADTNSFEMTKQTIIEGKHKLVLFPEGEVTRQPEALLPLRPGAIHLLLEAQGDLLQADEPVLIVPMAIRWRYKYDITRWLSFIVRLIERKLRLKAGSADLVERAAAAAASALAIMEREYFCPVHDHLSFERRVIELRGVILQRIAQLVSVDPPVDGSHLVWLRRTTNVIHSYFREQRRSMSPFQRHLHKEQCRKLKTFLSDLSKVQHLVGVTATPFHQPMTQERLAAVISKLEWLVLGVALPKGPRVATIAVGEPISLLDFWDAYKHDQEAGIDAATGAIAKHVGQLLHQLQGKDVRYVAAGR
jgi:1-acyl-sn-glycerol-3-phosphate acyltransferase